jgi:hypothetical protein
MRLLHRRQRRLGSGLDLRGLGGGRFRGRENGHRPAGAVQFEHLLLDAGDYFVVLLVILEEIRDIQKCVPFQADVHEGGLHARKHTRNLALMNAAGKGVLVLALMVDFDQLVVFEDRYTCFVAIGGDH